MRKIYGRVFFLLTAFLWCAGCRTAFVKPLHVQNIASNVKSEAISDKNYDVVYSINYEMMKKGKADIISFEIVRAFDRYRLDFPVSGNIKNILHNFINQPVESLDGKLENGIKKIGTASLYCFALGQNNSRTRMLLANDAVGVDVYLVLKNGNLYFWIKDFSLIPLKRNTAEMVSINGFVVNKEDIEALYRFSGNMTEMNAIRKQMLEEEKKLKQAEKEQPAAAETEETAETAETEEENSPKANMPETENV